MKIPTNKHRALAAFQPFTLFTILALATALANAQQLTQMFANGAGGISQVSAVQVSQDHFVTALINSTGNLEVIAWYANMSSNQLVRQGTWYAGAASAVAISSPFALNVGVSGAFTTAAINAAGKLDIIYWQLQSNGAISLISEVQGDSAMLVSVASVYSQTSGYPQFVTAIRNSSGNLEVSLWHVDPVYGIQLNGTAGAGAVNAVSIATLHDSISDVVTAVENSAGDLELIQWYYGRAGLPAVSRGNTTYTNTPAGNLAVAPGVSLLNNPPFLVNAFYTAAVNPSTGVIGASAWNQLLGLQASASGVISSQVSLASNNTTAITIGTPPAGGGEYCVRVFDQTNSSSFSEVAGAYGQSALAFSIAMVDTSSPNADIFAVAFAIAPATCKSSFGNIRPLARPIASSASWNGGSQLSNGSLRGGAANASILTESWQPRKRHQPYAIVANDR